MEDLPPHLLDEIGHFFDVYKALEPGKGTETRGWEGREAAEAAVEDARAAYTGRPSADPV
jgi:inorganic pyrophosphatase